ncbi:MAG: hypothetical protein KBD94_12775 [Pyrinomonadaceae bacterium]|nr:hypothetical protein [Pyrinomonadaceae bacterium]
MRKFPSLFLLPFLVATVVGQNTTGVADLSNYGVRIEPDRRLIAVLATLETASAKYAGGPDERIINTPLSESGRKFRDQLATDNAAVPDDLRRRVSTFVAAHKKRNPSATDSQLLSPFISMAYSLSTVPELADPVVTHDLPGSLLDVLDFAPLVREFYRRSTLPAKMDEYVQSSRREADGRLRSSTREMVGEILDYLHSRPILVVSEKIKTQTQKGKSKRSVIEKVETRTHERNFYLVPERLAARDTITFLNIRDDYFVIVPPDADVLFSEARRAFIQFVIDPLVVGNSKEIAPMRDWVKSLLEERRKTMPSLSPDVFLAISRSLVSAIDIRQAEFEQVRIATAQAREKIGRMKTDDEKRAVSADLEQFKQTMADDSALRLFEDYEKGSVLSFYFAEQLKGMEDSGFDIAASLREMIASFDPAKESGRVAATAEARRRAQAARDERKKHPEERVVTVENPVTARLLTIQHSIDAKDYSKAADDLKRLGSEFPREPRVYYSIGRVASLRAESINDPEAQARTLLEAKAAYSNVIGTAKPDTDKALLSLAYVALGRIYEFENQNDYAIKLYERAIELSDVPGGAFRDALAAKQRLLKPQ